VHEGRRPLGDAAERPRHVGDDERVEAIRHAGERQAVAPFEGIEGAGERGCHRE
jgi:hypothetical protein